MRYFKKYDECGVLISIGTGQDGQEITEAEYNLILNNISNKVAFVEKIYNNEITIQDVPEELREEVQRRVEERIAIEGTFDEQEISSEEFMLMLEEVL